MSGTPDYELKVKGKDAKHSTRVGAGWRTKDGRGINIKLDPGVALVGGADVYITMWPFESKEERQSRGAERGAAGALRAVGTRDDVPDFGGDDIPF